MRALTLPGSITDRTFPSFRLRNYRLWTGGQMVSMIGFFMQSVAQALLVLQLTNNGTVLGLVTALQFLPVFVVGPWAGLLSDRLDHRRLITTTQTVMMGSALALGIITLTGRASVAAVIILAAITGTANAFDQPTRRTFVLELVPPEMAANAVSLNGSVNNLAKIIGPALAGVAAVTLGLGWCFIINAVTFLALIAALRRIDPSEIHRSPRLAPAKGQIREGFRWIWATTAVRRQFAVLGFVAVVAWNWNVLVPMFATRELGGDGGTYGLIMAVMGVGSIAGTIWLARRPKVSDAVIYAGCGLLGAATFALGLAPNVLLACAAAGLVGVGSMIMFNGSIVSLQLGSPAELRGRVMAVFTMVVLGNHAFGGPLSGWAAERFGTRAALLGSGIVATTAGVFAWVFFTDRASVRSGEVAGRPAELGEHVDRPAGVAVAE